MAELGLMIQKENDNTCVKLRGGVYGCFNSALLYFILFCNYAVSPKGYGLTQSRVYPYVYFESIIKLDLKSY